MVLNKRKFEDMSLVQLKLKTELRRCGGVISGRRQELIDKVRLFVLYNNAHRFVTHIFQHGRAALAEIDLI